MTRGLETSEENLGNAVDGCPNSPNGKHFPNWDTVTSHILTIHDTIPLYVIDASCKHCGISGSRTVEPLSFNWD